jgi:hypothetical protein
MKDGRFLGPIRSVPKSVPRHSLRSAVIDLRNLLLIQGLRRKATVFQKHASEFRLRERIHTTRKSVRIVYLQTRGEVAERLKAADC